MWGLPVDFDASVFLGREVNVLCFSVSTLSLHFERPVIMLAGKIHVPEQEPLFITVSGRFSHQSTPSESVVMDHAPQPDKPFLQSELVQLLGMEVTKAQSGDSGELRLEFSNGHVFTLYDDPHYESYDIHVGDRRIIV